MTDFSPATDSSAIPPDPAAHRRRARWIRWGIPLGIAAIALGAPGIGSILTADASPTLPARTAAQLLVDVQRATVDTMSGTVVQRSDLGLPELPGLSQGPNSSAGSASLTSLVSGTHTLRVWYAGPDKARLAIMGTLGESDVIVNGHDVWTWSSEDHTATHRTLPARVAPHATPRPETPMTPEQAADAALKAIDPTTQVTTSGTTSVAGRQAYELVLSPRDGRSLIGQVRIAIDATTHVPLRVEVFATNSSKPAFEVGFTHVSFATPGGENFRFTPPPGTTVTEAGAPSRPSKPGPAAAPKIVGTGWTTVVIATLPKPASPAHSGTSVDRLLGALPHVSGAWGSGRLLRSALFTVLLTDDGRILAGAVAPEMLYAAAT